MPSTSSSRRSRFASWGRAVEIDSVVGQVLGHEIQLSGAVGGELASLDQNFVARFAGVFTAHQGDRAESAEPVATFGDL